MSNNNNNDQDHKINSNYKPYDKFMTPYQWGMRDIYFAQGPIRVYEPDFIKKEREINRHQEKVKHSDKCRCKKYEFNDLVVMYEHIEQYPQFRCYCKWCIDKLKMDCYLFDEVQEEVHHAFKGGLGSFLKFKKGIDLEE